MTATIDERLETLRGAKARRLPWGEVAIQVAALLDSKEWRSRYPNRKEEWEALQEVTGYRPNVLQRMNTAKSALMKIEEQHRAELRDVLGPKNAGKGALLLAVDSFPKAELATRAFKHAPEQGVALLRRIIAENLPVTRVQEELADILNGLPEGKVVRFRSANDAGRELERRLALLEENASRLYGNSPVRLYHGRYRFSLVHVDAVALAWEDLSVSFVDGFIVLPSTPPRAEAGHQDLLSRADYAASFFRHLWLYTPSPDQWSMERLPRDLGRLDLATVGIIALDNSGDLRVLRQARAGEKPPRYRTVLEEVMRQGIPDFAAE